MSILLRYGMSGRHFQVKWSICCWQSLRI